MIRQNQFLNIVSSSSRDYTKLSNTSIDRRQQALGIDSSDFLAELSTSSLYSTTPSPKRGEIKIKNTRRDAKLERKTKPGKVKKC
jgi:hypothetical protein